MKYKVVIFDFDGTLFDSEKIHLAIYKKIFAKFNINLTNAEYYQRYAGLTDDDMFPKILQDNGIGYDTNLVSELKRQKVSLYLEHIKTLTNATAIPGAKAFIEKYQGSVKYAICSNSTQLEVISTLENIENGSLHSCFAEIITINDVSLGKPSPAGYTKIANLLKVSPNDCLVVEDSKSGIAAAKAAQMDVVAITTSLPRSEIPEVTYVVDNYDELQNWFEEQQRCIFSMRR